MLIVFRQENLFSGQFNSSEQSLPRVQSAELKEPAQERRKQSRDHLYIHREADAHAHMPIQFNSTAAVVWCLLMESGVKSNWFI